MSSSSDSEEDALLKEALVPGFSIESVQKKSLPKPNTKRVAAETLKSLRSVPDKSSDQDFRVVDISPEHQKYIAKKLEEFLDGQLKEVDTLTIAWKDMPDNPAVKKGKKGGVRLLAASRRSIKCVDEEVDDTVFHNSQHKPKKHKQRKLTDDDSTLSESEKLKEAAVSPEWVLEGRGVFGKNCYRGEVITGAVHSLNYKSNGKIKTDK